MTARKLSRREMLKLMGTGAVGAVVLSACGAQQPAAPEAKEEAPQEEAPAEEAQEDTAPPPPAEDVTLVLSTWGGAERSEKRVEAVRSVYPDLPEVEVIVGGGGDFEVAESVRLALAAGGEGLPDMVQLNYTQVPEFAAAGETLDLGPSFEPYEQDMYAGALELSKYDNRYVCYPYEIKSKIFYYRDDMFGEAGISLDDMNTVDGFIAAGKAFNNKFPDSYILNLGPEPVQYWIGELLSADPDARMADIDGKYFVTEKKAFADAFSFLKRVYDENVSVKIDDWSSDWQQAFADEAICGFMCASWVKFFLPSFAPAQSGQWAVDLWPTLEPMADQRYGSEAGGAVYIVPKQSQHPELAAETLAKTFLDKDGAVAAYEATGMTPLMKSAHDEFLEKAANPERAEGMTDEDWAAHPANFFGPGYFEAELASYDYVKVFPYDPSAAAEIDILRNWLIRYMADEVELEDALAGAQADMESQIGNPYDV